MHAFSINSNNIINQPTMEENQTQPTIESVLKSYS